MKKTLKIAFIAAACLTIAPIISYAGPELTTNNTTQYYSTVKLTTGLTTACAGKGHPGRVTGPKAPYKTSISTPWWEVEALCLGSGNLCGANVIVSANATDLTSGDGCKGDVVAKIVMNLSTGKMQVTQVPNPENIIATSPANYTMSIAP